MAHNEDAVRRVFARIRVLADNPPAFPNEHDVRRYHELLDELESVGYDTTGFRFDVNRALCRQPRTIRMVGGRVQRTYDDSDPRTIRPDIFINQVKSLLLYFELPAPITFHGPERDAPES